MTIADKKVTRDTLFSNEFCLIVRTENDSYFKGFTGKSVNTTLWVRANVKNFTEIDKHIDSEYSHIFKTVYEKSGIFIVKDGITDSDIEDVFTSLTLKYA